MGVKIVTGTNRSKPTGVAQYWARLVDAVQSTGVAVDWVMLDDWKAGRGNAHPARDLIIVDNQDALQIQPEYAVIAVQHGCAMEHGLRCRTKAHIELGRHQQLAAERGRTFWVACSDWAAYHCRLHMGVRADRIIYGGVDVDRFIPSERQRLRNAHTATVLHHAKDDNKGRHLLAGLTAALKDHYDLRELHCSPDAVPEAMRDGDIWLCLSASEGLPTVVMEAMACGLLVVGTNVGVLWPQTCGTPLREARLLGWLNKEIGGIVFDWQQRDYPDVVADHIRSAWRHRNKLCNGRDYARRWWSLEAFGRKWAETILAANTRFGLVPSGGQ